MVVVTGGTGLAGSHLVMQLLLSGAKVRALKRPDSDTSLVEKVFGYYGKNFADYSSRLEWLSTDLLDFDEVREALEGAETLYHMAALVSFDPADKSELLRSNPGVTEILVNASLDAGVGTFCHVSSVAALGRVSGTGAINENHWWTPGKANSNYSISKFTAEREVWRAAEEGLNVVIVNPSVIIGPGNWHRGTGRLVNMAWRGIKYYTRGVTGFVSAGDVAAACIHLIDKGIRNQRFILSSENMSWKDFFSAFAREFGKKEPAIHAGNLTGLAWRGAWIQSIFTGKRPFISRESAESSKSVFYYDSSRIRETDFEFTPMKEVIAHTALCFKEDLQKKEITS